MDFLKDLLAAVLALVVLDTVTAANRLAPRLVKRAANKMPTDDLRDRYEEEWLAELDSVSDYKLIVLIRALGIWFTSHDAAARVSDHGTMTLAQLVKAGFSSTVEILTQTPIVPKRVALTAPGFIGCTASMRLAKHLADGSECITTQHWSPTEQVIKIVFPSGVGLGYRIFGRLAFYLLGVVISSVIIVRTMPPRRWLAVMWMQRKLPREIKFSFGLNRTEVR